MSTINAPLRDGDLHTLPSCVMLRELMERYTTDQLVNETPEALEKHLRDLVGRVDPDSEGYRDPSRQRDLSIKYHWGHNHDFGAFSLEGRMHDRHIHLLASFMDGFGLSPDEIQGARILDIGCWTGGTSLLLAAMGAHVHAIEEVRKYADTVSYLAHAFGVEDHLTCERRSLYECDTPEFRDRFDLVLYAGVLYHVTDPILSLRICFNALRDGGRCLLETAVVRSDECVLQYDGPSRTYAGSVDDLDRGGWNWFVPSGNALCAMLDDVGFERVDLHAHPPRAHAIATRVSHVDICRAGLSVPAIP
ncbi:MAG: class I SAM-dependent methyltransferase [Phycisphaerales bacterium JB043]